MSDNDKHKLFVKLTAICGALAFILIIICACSKSFVVQFVLGGIAGILIALTITFFLLISVYPIEKQEHEPSNKPSQTSNLIDEHKNDIKLLDNGEVRYFQSWHQVSNIGKTDEEARVLIYREDNKHYHLCLDCFKKQSYKDTFDYWVTMPLLEAQEKGLNLCPLCQYETLSEEEKLKQILTDANFMIVRLAASGNEEAQSTLSLTNVAEHVFIEYDYDKYKYIVTDKYYNKLGAISESTLNKLHLEQSEIENLTCCIYNIEINDNNKYVCDIALILGTKQQNIEDKQQDENKSTNDKAKKPVRSTKKSAFEETIERCTKSDYIKRIDYRGDAIPKNASIVTLKNNHKFSAEDFLSVYGYQVHKTAKLEYYFFLDKSRKKQDENGNTIYPAIKITAATIAHFPDMTSEETKRYIAISYADRATKRYAIPAEEIDDLSHYYMGKYLYKEYQRINKSDYCVIDIETTGLSRENDQIVEISALRVRNNEITDIFTQLVKPTIPISSSAMAINGITNEMVEDAPTIKEVISSFVEFVGNDIVVGHNIDSFDLLFITRDCNDELGIPFDNESIDTYLLARNTFDTSNYQLATLCRELGIAQSNHRAESDCISTKELFDKIKAYKSLDGKLM